MLKYDSVIYF